MLAPVVGPRAAEALLRGLDDLLLSGGTDIDPGYYGEEAVPELLGPTVPERDAFEMALVGLALRRGMPVFGICRGMRLVDVALGGTLYQDLRSGLGGTVLEHCAEAPKHEAAHEVGVREGSCSGGSSAPPRSGSTPTTTRGSKTSPRAWWGRPAAPTGLRRPSSIATSRSAGSWGFGGTPKRCATSAPSTATSSRPTSVPPGVTPCSGTRPRASGPDRRIAYLPQGAPRRRSDRQEGRRSTLPVGALSLGREPDPTGARHHEETGSKAEASRGRRKKPTLHRPSVLDGYWYDPARSASGFSSRRPKVSRNIRAVCPLRGSFGSVRKVRGREDTPWLAGYPMASGTPHG